MRYWIVLFLFCLGIGPAVQAQNKGVVKGRVFDLASNEAIPFANVVVYGTTLGGATDEEGRFRLENVPPGLVRLEVSSIGYQTLVTVGFLLGTAGERLRFGSLPRRRFGVIGTTSISFCAFAKRRQELRRLKKIPEATGIFPK